MKKYIVLPFLICLLALIPVLPAFAAEVTDPPARTPDQCGEEIFWSFEDSTLTISGTGKMDDFEPKNAPWEAHKDKIKTVVFQEGVTYVGACSFYDYDKLEQVDFGTAMYELGKSAFFSCDKLTSITLPATFKIFGEDSLRSCRRLTQIHCEGGFPSFRLNSLWDTYATIYYPASHPWGVQYIQQLEEAFHGRIEFLASDGTDPYQPSETENTQPSSEATEDTTPSETAEATESTELTEEPSVAPESSVPATQPPTQPPTQPATQPQQTQAAQTQPPETAPADQEDTGSQSWIVPVIIGAAAVCLLLGSGITILAGGRRRKGKYSR